MKNAAPFKPVTANTFHAGNTCPRCQETVQVAQMICFCTDCGAIHHETCWLHKGGCSSYHCDDAVRTESPVLRADIVISNTELERVVLAPKAPRRSAQEISEAFLPRKPEGRSKLALASAAVAGVSLMGIIGVFSGNPQLLMLGVLFCLIALAMGVISMVIINNPDNRRSGMSLAGIGIGVPVFFIIVYFARLHSVYDRTAMQHKTDLKISEHMPSEEQLARMTPAAADAMRSNVVIKVQAGILGDTSYGSGIVLRLDGSKVYILSNKHVVGEKTGNANINVVFFNGEQSKATVDWVAPDDIDLAIISCQALLLKPREPARIFETLLGPGEKVFAVGNPMGLAWSYTEGSISSVRTSFRGKEGLDLYQTQTPINSGNSGGGLYSTDGVLVGVNTWTQDKTVAEGINFAITTKAILRLLTAQEKELFLGQKSGETTGPRSADPIPFKISEPKKDTPQ